MHAVLRFVVLVPIALAVALAACGDDTAAPPEYGAVEGWVYQGNATVVLGNSATPPAGTVALADVTVEVVGTDRSATTASDGYFLIEEVPPGIHTLRVNAPGMPADFPLTIFVTTRVVVGERPVPRADAWTMAQAQLGSTVDFANAHVF